MKVQQISFPHEEHGKLYGYNGLSCYVYNTSTVDLIQQSDITCELSGTPSRHCVRLGKYFYGVQQNNLYRFSGTIIDTLPSPLTHEYGISTFNSQLILVENTTNILFVLRGDEFQQFTPAYLPRSTVRISLHSYDSKLFILCKNAVNDFEGDTVKYAAVEPNAQIVSASRNWVFYSQENSYSVALDLSNYVSHEVCECPLLLTSKLAVMADKTLQISEFCDQSGIQIDPDYAEQREAFEELLRNDQKTAEAFVTFKMRCGMIVTQEALQLEQSRNAGYTAVLESKELDKIMTRKAAEMAEINQLLHYKQVKLMNKFVMDGRFWEDQQGK